MSKWSYRKLKFIISVIVLGIYGVSFLALAEIKVSNFPSNQGEFEAPLQ